jgi:hypothetical protein
MNAGTCWGKNSIDPRGRSVEKPREATLTFKKKGIVKNKICEEYLNLKRSDYGATIRQRY